MKKGDNLIDYFQFSKYVLHKIQEGDFEEVINLINKAYSYQDKYKDEPRINYEKLIRQTQKSDFYVVKENGAIIGCIYTRNKDGSLHFGLLTVDEAHRGTGLAPALINAAESYAKNNGYPSIQLDYMSIAPWLKCYYEKYGFQEIGEIENWGTIDLIRMKKELS